MFWTTTWAHREAVAQRLASGVVAGARGNPRASVHVTFDIIRAENRPQPLQAVAMATAFPPRPPGLM